jgi:hypothetical protein
MKDNDIYIYIYITNTNTNILRPGGVHIRVWNKAKHSILCGRGLSASCIGT